MSIGPGLRSLHDPRANLGLRTLKPNEPAARCLLGRNEEGQEERQAHHGVVNLALVPRFREEEAGLCPRAVPRALAGTSSPIRARSGSAESSWRDESVPDRAL